MSFLAFAVLCFLGGFFGAIGVGAALLVLDIYIYVFTD